MAVPLQRLRQRLDLDALQIDILIGRLVGDYDIEVGKGLAEQAGEDNGETSLAPAGRNENINERHDPDLLDYSLAPANARRPAISVTPPRRRVRRGRFRRARQCAWRRYPR